MRITNLELHHFRGFEHLALEFSKEANVIVFIGENGRGKTSILDAIAKLLEVHLLQSYSVGAKEGIKHKATDVANGSLDKELKLLLKVMYDIEDNSVTYYGGYDIYERSPYLSIQNPLNLTLYYHQRKSTKLSFLEFIKPQHKVKGVSFGEGIALDTWNLCKKRYEAANTPYNDAFGIDLTDSNTTQKNFEAWFLNLENKELQTIVEEENFKYRLPELEVFRATIKAFYNNLNDTQFDDIKGQREKGGKLFDRTNDWIELRKNEARIRLNQLSSGEQALLMLVTDITRRLLDITENPTAEKIQQSKGIVLIDEIDNHLHPKWQRNVLPTLVKTFPKIQFIVTTHSPLVISNLLPAEEVENGAIEKAVVYNLTTEGAKQIKTIGRDVSSVLNDFFGVERRSMLFQKKIDSLFAGFEEDTINVTQLKQQLTELQQLLGTSDPDVQSAETILNSLEQED